MIRRDPSILTVPPLDVRPAGVQGLYVVVGDEISDSVNSDVLRLARTIGRSITRGVFDIVPGYGAVYVEFDPLVWSFAELAAEIQRSPLDFDSGRSSRLVRIPVAYGGEFGPDLEQVAKEVGLSPAEVIATHSRGLYRIYFIGFTPGFPFLGGMDPRLAVPRLPQPRLKVPPGSVGIAGRQTGIYPMASPGGWRIIGRTRVVLYDPNRRSPVLLRPGDQVRFEVVSGS